MKRSDAVTTTVADLHEAFRRWVVDARENPQDYREAEDVAALPVEEVVSGFTHRLLHHLAAIHAERKETLTIADGGPEDPATNAEGESERV